MDYRPIYLLPSCSKILERCIHDWLSFHHLTVKEQYGFVKYKSTSSNLLIFKDFVAKSLNSQEEVYAIYTDFVETVGHNVHLSKLSLLAFPPPSINSWLSSYISYLPLVFLKVPYYSLFLSITSPPPFPVCVCCTPEILNYLPLFRLHRTVLSCCPTFIFWSVGDRLTS